MDYQTIKQQSGSQKEINKLFLKACKENDIEAVRYLLSSDEIAVKAQLNISKQTGFANDKKDGFVPLIYAVQYNAKDVYKYFLEDIDWFSTMTLEGKLEVLGKASYTNDIETFNYLFQKFEEKTKINNYQKPYLVDKILESVIDKGSDKIFNYVMNLPKEYREHINNKNDLSLVRAAKINPKMLEYMLSHPVYQNLFTELYLLAFDATQKNPHSALILFKYGIVHELFDIFLSKDNKNYVREKIKDNVFKTYHDKLIHYIHEEQLKISCQESLLKLANENIKDYFYTEDEYYKNKNNQKEAPVLEYAIKHELLSKQTRETIVFDIVKHGYKNLMEIIAKYPKYGEGLNLNSAFIEALHTASIGKDKYQNIINLLNIDVDKKIDVCAEEFELFRAMETIKSFNQNYDEEIKKVFSSYCFWPNQELKDIYQKNSEMLRIVEMKELNMKLSSESANVEYKNTKKNKI